MSEKSDAVFEAIFALEEIRQALRDSAPKHELDDGQKAAVEKSCIKVEKSLKALRGML